MAAQATAPAAPALLSARGSLPTGVPGPAPAGAAAKAERVQTVGPDHLRWAQRALECHQGWAPGPSAAPPVGVHGPIGPSGWLEPRARAVLLLGLFPGSLVLSFGAVSVSPLGHLRAPLPPSMVGGPGSQWDGGCPAAAAQIEGILPFVDRLGHGSGIRWVNQKSLLGWGVPECHVLLPVSSPSLFSRRITLFLLHLLALPAESLSFAPGLARPGRLGRVRMVGEEGVGGR